MENIKKHLHKNIKFKKDFVPEINQKSFQSQGLCTGELVKISKENLYFNINLKNILKVKKRSFINFFFKIEKMIHIRFSNHPYLAKDFLKNIKIGNKYRFIIYQIKSGENDFFIHFEKTLDYIKYALLFYEFEHFKKKKKKIRGFVLNNVKAGFSVAINGLVTFLPNNKVNINKVLNPATGNKKSSLLLNSFSKFKILKINFERKNIVLKKV